MGIFFNKYKFYIKYVGKDPVPTKEIIEPVLGGPKWFANLCPYMGKTKTALDRFPVIMKKTAKSCPAMVELFRNSFLLKFPCDLILETKENGKYLWRKPSDTDVLDVKDLDEGNYEFEPPLSSFITIKFCFPFLFQAPYNQVSIIEPIYWKIQPYRVAPGIMNFMNNREALPLNAIVFFEKKDKIYEFKRGEPMVLYYTFHKSTLEINENLKDTLTKQKTFNHRWIKKS